LYKYNAHTTQNALTQLGFNRERPSTGMGGGGQTTRDPYTVTVSTQVGMVQGLACLLDARLDAYVSPLLPTVLQYCMLQGSLA
jgi:hypothetical protein